MARVAQPSSQQPVFFGSIRAFGFDRGGAQVLDGRPAIAPRERR